MTRAISGFAEYGSTCSLRSDQNIDIAIAASTDECGYRRYCHRSRLFVEQDPFSDEQDSAECQRGGDHAGRAEPDEKATCRLHRGNGQNGRHADEEREARDREPRQEKRVAHRVGRHLLRNQHCGSKEHDKSARASRRGSVAFRARTFRHRRSRCCCPGGLGETPQQRPGIDEIRRRETFRVTAVHRGERRLGFLTAALALPEPGEAHSRTEFPRLAVLPPGDVDGAPKALFGFNALIGSRGEEQFSLEAVKLRLVEAIVVLVDDCQRFGQRCERLFEAPGLGIRLSQHAEIVRNT